MKPQNKSAVTILVLFGSTPIFAQTNDVKTLAQKAVAHFPRLKELQRLTEISEARTRIAEGGYLPSVSGVGSYTYLYPISATAINIPISADRTIHNEFAVMTDNNVSIQANVNQLIYDFGRTAAGVSRANHDALAAKHTAEATAHGLAYQVAGVYYGVMFLQKSIAVQETQIELLTSTLKLIGSRMKNGDALEYDIISTKVRLDNTRNRQTELRNQLEKQYNLLQYLTGEEVRPQISANDEFPSANVGEAENLLKTTISGGFAQSKDVAAAQDRVRAAEFEADANNKFFLPTIAANGAVGIKNGLLPVLTDLRFNFALGASVSVPLYAGGRDRAQYEIALASLEASRINADGLRESLRRDMQNALADLRTASEKLTNAESLVRQAHYGYELAESRYKNGILTSLDLQSAQAGMLEADLSKLQQEYRRCLAGLELKRLAGVEYWAN